MEEIKLIKFTDDNDNYKLMHKWCSNKFVYEWFEQRILSFEEIVNKYRIKLQEDKQKLFMINYNGKNIGFVQVYNTLQNFRRYYDSEKPEEVQTYIKYIAEHDVDQLDSDIHKFSLDDEPALLFEPEEPTR